MSENKATVLLEIKEKLDGLANAQAKVGQFQNQLTSFGQALKTGFGVEIVSRIFSALAKIPPAFEKTVMAGLDFNAAIESNKIAIAAALRSSDPGGLPTFNAALQRSGELHDRLKTAAKSARVDFSQLAQTFAGTTAILTRVNIPLERQIDLLRILSSATQALGVAEARQQITGLLSGRFEASSVLANALNVTRDGLERARESGKLLEYLEEHAKGFAEGAAAAANSWDALKGKLGSQLKTGAGAATKGLFEDGKELMRLAVQTEAIPKTAGFVGEGYASGSYLLKELVRATVVWGEVGKRLMANEHYFGSGGIREELNIRFDKNRDRRFGVEDGPRPGPGPASIAPIPFGVTFGVTSGAAMASLGPLMAKMAKQLQEQAKAVETDMRQLYTSSTKALFPAQDNLARRGIYVSSSVAHSQDNTLAVQQGMLAALKDIRASLLRGLQVDFSKL